MTITWPSTTQSSSLASSRTPATTLAWIMLSKWYDVNGILEHGIIYKRKELLRFDGFTNVDCADNTSDRKSTSRFLLSLNSGAISRSSKKQFMSSTEVKYRGTVVAACKAVWLKNFNKLVNKPIPIHCNNLSPACNKSGVSCPD